MSDNWMTWNIDATPREILDSVMEVVNDVIREKNIQIDVVCDEVSDENFEHEAVFYMKEVV